jgi:hypothetical protein
MTATDSTTAPAEQGVNHAHPHARIGVGSAIRRYPLVILIPVVLLVGLGVAAGLRRGVTYSASAEIVVQPLAPNVTQLPGAIQSAEDLATNQSRLIGSDGITTPLAQQFKTTGEDIAARVSATPVPSSTIIKIEAEGDSPTAAVRLANAAAARFSKYANGQVQSSTDTHGTLQEYEDAATEFARAQATKERIDRATPTPPETTRARVSAAAATAQLQQNALAQQYESFVQGRGTAPSVHPFVTATSASSNRLSNLEIFVFAGLVGGLAIGAALVVLLANRRSPERVVA